MRKVHDCDNLDKETLNELLSPVLEIDLVDVHGRTPLMFCSFNEYPRFVQHLVDSGADVDVPDESDMTALNWAVLGDCKETFPFFPKILHR